MIKRVEEDSEPEDLLPEISRISMSEYATGLRQHGTTVVNGREWLWTSLESGAVIRRPLLCFARPDPPEIRDLFSHYGVVIATYLVEPDDTYPANAFLYVCSDYTYSLDKLSSSMRRNTRHGLRQLRVTCLSREQILAHGLQAFADTRRRNGLTDGTRAEFLRRYSSRTLCGGHVFIGAWKDTELAGFLSIIHVDDWAEIEGSFSVSSMLGMKPNEALLFTALSHYLRSGRIRAVTSGLSSVQEISRFSGLDEFKKRVGFDAKPVHRAFAFHPLLRPFANAGIRRIVGTACKVLPGNRRLNKIRGVLDLVTGNGVQSFVNCSGGDPEETVEL